MDSQQKAALLALKGKALADIDVRDIEDELMRHGLLNLADRERIHAVRTTSQQTNTLVDLILEKNKPNTFEIFLKSIEAPYQHVWKKLVETRNSPQTALPEFSADQCETIFIEGGVPILPRGNVELEFVVQLKEYLVKLSKRSDGGWIVTWGQAGSGKSIMAAQAIRGFSAESRRIVAYFFNKVFWLHIGKLSKDEKVRDSELLVKMQNFCKRIDTSGRYQPPVDLEAARDMLRSTLVKTYPVCLIVLDDVWDPIVLKYFNVQARVLITTRHSDILSRVQRGGVGRAELIHVDKGFTETASINLLSQMVLDEREPPTSENVNSFKKIHSGCDGSPFVISIFGSLLQNSMSRFDYIYKKYKSTAFGSENLESGDYHYENIMDAIMVSVEDLSASDRDLYLRLVIFMSNSLLSPAFLAMYCWTDLEFEEACEKMELFVHRSIATEENIKSDMQAITLHDIIVSSLRTKFRTETVKYNSEFVSNVLQCRKDCASWHDMEDDCDYLAYNFIYHLVSDGSVPIDEKRDLLLDFDFLSWLCCKVGPDSLAFSYRFAVKALDLQRKDTWQEMESFIRSPEFRIQSLSLAGDQSASAIIQLALNFAEGDSLQQHVRNCAMQHPHSSCFYHWMNKAQTEKQIADTLELGCNVRSYTFNKTFTHVIVVSDCSVVIKDLMTRSTLYRRQDKEFDSDHVVSAFFGSESDSIWLLTASSIIRYQLPEFTLDAANLMSPSMQKDNKRYTLLFPIERPRHRTSSNEKDDERTPAQILWRDDEQSNTEFTAVCFLDEHRLIVGSQNGRIYELTVTGTFINCSFDYQIDKKAQTNLSVNHIASSDSSIVVTGPDCCAYVYETRPNDNVESSSVRKYTGFQEQRDAPIQSMLFDIQPNSRLIVTISKHEIHIWDPYTLRTLATEQGQNSAEFTSIALSDKGAYLAVSTSKAHIYLYRVIVDSSSITGGVTLELVNEFNGSGTRARCLNFGEQSLYSLSELSSESVLTKWRVNIPASSPCFKRNVNRQSSIFFGNECCTLRVRTVYDAVSSHNNQIVMACQSVRRSLLILESTENGNLRHVGKYKGEGSQLGKVLAVGLASDAKSAVFTFPKGIVSAMKNGGGSWTFTYKPEAVVIREVAMLPDGGGFIGSDKSRSLVLYGNKRFERICKRDFEHDRLMPLRMPNAISNPEEVQAVVLTPRTWHFVTESLSIIDGGSIDSADVDSATTLVCLDISDDGRYAAGGLSNGRLMLWAIRAQEEPVSVAARKATPLRSVRFAPGGRLLAGAFDNSRFSLWHLTSGEALALDTLLDCHPLPKAASPSGDYGCGIGCDASVSLAWSVSSGTGFEADGRRYRLIMASDRCVWLLCCLSARDIASRKLLDPSCISLVPQYSCQGVIKALVLGSDAADLLYVDNAHTVFWLRALAKVHGLRRCSAP